LAAEASVLTTIPKEQGQKDDWVFKRKTRLFFREQGATRAHLDAELGGAATS
jgi:hypothetical protein